MPNPNLEYLYALNREGVKLDLSVTKMFSSMIGNPEKDFSAFHVAGTNGKGSITSFIYNMLQQHTPTGMYISPHLVTFNERIMADDSFIEDEYISHFIQQHMPEIENLKLTDRNPTFFEVTTVMAFKYFSDRHVRTASVEVGLGGRLDSTNIVEPEVSIIANIGYDHFDKLGCSLTSIAYEKAGIIKRNVPVILLDDKDEVVKTVSRVADLNDSRLIRVSGVSSVFDLRTWETGMSFVLKTPEDTYEIKTSMIGEFQVRNIAAAVLAIENGKSISPSKVAIERGISQARWPARMEIIRNNPPVMVDCAHNPPAAHALVSSFKKFIKIKPTLIIGMLEDKDFFSYLRIIHDLSDDVIITTPQDTPRAMPAEQLGKVAAQVFKNVKVIADPTEAYEYAKANSSYVLVAGSMYLVGYIKMLEKSSIMPFDRLTDFQTTKITN
ncbi:MAG: bifunctional folylpolyglutamate synthase/dihydrofolate synthase [Candidatus Thermoplasmatota archaeon]|nr:bifunctional folylpolyglutamate synthase/dihydrofolate synthase [Candidatus Thermoplasmatota archaeon]